MTYHRPSTLQDAVTLLADGATVAAGCTDLFPATSFQDLNDAGHAAILDITAIPELAGIERAQDGWRIGAAATWTDVVRADLPPAFDALQAAAREVGSVQIQNAGTVGGNLCNASPAADGAPPLLALDAEVELRSAAGARRMPLGDFLLGPRKTALRSSEVLTAILIPDAATRGRSAFSKLGARRHLVISIAMTAVRLHIAEGKVAVAAIAVGACSAVAVRLPKVEAALIGQPADAALADRVTDAAVAASLSPIDDVRADAGYRSAAAATCIRRDVARLAAS